MPNMKKHISKHNAKILRNPKEDEDTRSCNCKVGRECPLNGKCLQKNIVYRADVECNNTTKTYYGLTEQTFKARWNNHQFSLRNEDHTQQQTDEKTAADRERIGKAKWSAKREKRSHQNAFILSIPTALFLC